MDKLVTTAQGAVLTIRLNRPEKRNSIDMALATRLHEVLSDANSDPEVRVIVIRGSAPVDFAGMDIGWYRAADEGERHRYTAIQSATRELLAFGSTPVIAGVATGAYGGGLHMVNRCDISIVAETAGFASSEIKFGLHAGGSLLADVGRSRSMELNLTGRKFTGDEARHWGLFSQVVPEAEVDDTVRSYAEQISEMEPAAVAATKRATNYLVDLQGAGLHRRYAELMSAQLSTTIHSTPMPGTKNGAAK